MTGTARCGGTGSTSSPTAISLIRYDERGNGLSDWETPELSFDAFVDDLESVVECRRARAVRPARDQPGRGGGDRLCRAPPAAGAAAGHLQRLCGGLGGARAIRQKIARREAMLTLTADRLGRRQSGLPAAVHQPSTSPRRRPSRCGWFNEMQRLSASPENAVKLQRALADIDVRDLLPKVQTPTLVFHSRGDQAVPFAARARSLPPAFPGAAFVPLESKNHILVENEPAWASSPRSAASSWQRRAADAGDPRHLSSEPSRSTTKCECLHRPDGARIAYAVSGEGFPLVKSPNWMTHLDHDWTNPVLRHWIAECSGPIASSGRTCAVSACPSGAAQLHFRIDGRRPWRR